MIDYALAGRTWSSACSIVFSHVICKRSESGGATEWFFANFVEQWCCKKICGAMIQSGGESDGRAYQVAEIVGDLFEIGGAASGGL